MQREMRGSLHPRPHVPSGGRGVKERRPLRRDRSIGNACDACGSCVGDGHCLLMMRENKIIVHIPIVDPYHVKQHLI